MNKKYIKILALIAVIAFIMVCAMVYFKPIPSHDGKFDIQVSTAKTYSDFETTWTDNFATVVSESTTEYYDEKGSVKYVLNTKTDFRSTVVDGNTLRSYCKCTAEYNNQIATQIFKNDTTVTNMKITEEFATKTIDESTKKCANDCIKYGAEYFFGIK